SSSIAFTAVSNFSNFHLYNNKY
ncbi:unnamed protein product, partial [Allacma fusca]